MSELVTTTPAEVLLPVDVNSARQAMTAYQQVVSAILEPSDWQGAPNKPGSFVKKSGWRKVAKAYRLSTELRGQAVERDDNGQPLRAEAVVRALAENGQYMDGTGFCSTSEPRFARASGRHKLENDLRATAETRAKNRAISDLVGFGWVSAEEVEVEEAPEYGPPAGKIAPTLEPALHAIYGPDYDPTTLRERLELDAGGYLPRIVARAVMLVAAHRPGRNTQAGTGTEGNHPQNPPEPEPEPEARQENDTSDQQEEPVAETGP